MPKNHKPLRRSVLRLTDLEDRVAPAIFNIPAGDIAALRSAITTSNINNESDVINLAAGATYTFADVADPLDGGNALPTVKTDTNNVANTLTINGNGATLTRSTAAGTPFFRFLREDLSAALVPPPTLNVSGINFSNGLIDSTTSLMGGAIFLHGGNLSLTDCTFTGNQAPNGGAIGSDQLSTTPRPLNVTRGTFTQNSATGTSGNGAGGAIYNLSSSVLGIADSTFSGNTSTAEGGAVRVQTSSTTTTITGSTFTNNTANGGNGGGAIFIQGQTIAANLTVTGNTSGNGGAGLWNQGGPLSLTNSTFTNNQSTGSTSSGGGIFSQGTTTISGTNISNNTSGGGGGGLWVQGNSNETLTLTDSTVANNFANGATSSGGGIFAQINFSMTNVTVTGNRASNGGGIAYAIGGNQASLLNSTVTDNRVFFALASGGGVRVQGSNFQMGNTIVAGNFFEATVTSGTGPDIGGTVASLGYNLIGNGSGTTVTGTTTGNQVGTTGAPIDPKLAPLQMNGGRTPTRLPLAGSPVINAGDPSFASPPGPSNDERGSGYARVQFGRVDIGAAEAQVGRVAAVVVNGGALQRSRVTDLTITFSSVVTLPANPASAFTLINTTAQPNVAVNLSVDLSGSTPTQTVAKLSWSGPVTEGGGSLIDGNYTLTILGSQITGEGGLQLDGNGDGTPGGDNVSTLYRLFGDVNGDKTVNITDLTAFRNAFGASSTDANYRQYFDFSGDGVINLTDLTQFRNRFGTILP